MRVFDDVFNSDEVFGDEIIDSEGSTSVFSEFSMDFVYFGRAKTQLSSLFSSDFFA